MLHATLARHKLLGSSESHTPSMTPAHRRQLKPAWRLMRARWLLRTSERARVFKLFEAASVDVIEYKGGSQHAVLHGSEKGRDSVDLDLWVRPLDFRRALRILTRSGYSVHSRLDPARIDGPLPNELPLLHDTLRLEVDVHQHLFSAFYGLQEVDQVLRRHVVGHRLTDEATAFLALICGGKDLWNTLRLLADIHRIPPAWNPAIDALATQTHTRGIVERGRELAAILLGDAEPSPKVLPWIQMLQQPRQDAPSLDRARRYLSTRERLSSRLRCLVQLPTAVRYQDLIEGPVDGIRFPLRRLRRLSAAYLG